MNKQKFINKTEQNFSKLTQILSASKEMQELYSKMTKEQQKAFRELAIVASATI